MQNATIKSPSQLRRTKGPVADGARLVFCRLSERMRRRIRHRQLFLHGTRQPCHLSLRKLKSCSDCRFLSQFSLEEESLVVEAMAYMTRELPMVPPSMFSGASTASSLPVEYITPSTAHVPSVDVVERQKCSHLKAHLFC